MRRKQNVIIFSAGESVRNGNVEYIKNKLLERDIVCYDWRELFSKAHDMNNIALLPSLSKKIPTFDFALIIAEAVDTIHFRGEKEQTSMRDNVIFELGLCVMALGIERVILLAEEGIRIPDDLIGIGKIGIECIYFTKKEVDESIIKVEKLIKKRANNFAESFDTQLSEIINHINVNSELISPVFVGAAVSSAEAYFLNFVIRLLENVENGFSYQTDDARENYSFPKDFKIKIVIPASVDSLSRSKIIKFYEEIDVEKFVIYDAGTRGLYFNGKFDTINNSLLVIDVPTSITASYAVVNSVLNIDSDDEYDALAEERFITKEMDIYAFALKKLLVPAVAEKRLTFIKDQSKRESIINLLQNVKVEMHVL